MRSENLCLWFTIIKSYVTIATLLSIFETKTYDRQSKSKYFGANLVNIHHKKLFHIKQDKKCTISCVFSFFIYIYNI